MGGFVYGHANIGKNIFMSLAQDYEYDESKSIWDKQLLWLKGVA